MTELRRIVVLLGWLLSGALSQLQGEAKVSVRRLRRVKPSSYKRQLEEQAVDLNKWFAESYSAVAGFGQGIWTVADDNLSVFQSVNGQPTLYCSDFTAIGNAVQGRIEITTISDNDYVGFALGFNPEDSTNSDADYLLIDWKQSTQSFNFGNPSCTPGGVAARGLAVSRVTGIPTADEMWTHMDFDSPDCSPLGDGLTELQRATTLGDVGWTEEIEYDFRFEFTGETLMVFVDGTLELNVTGTFSDGRLCYYNFSQQNVRYSGFTQEALPTAAPTTSPTASPKPDSTAAPTSSPVSTDSPTTKDKPTVPPLTSNPTNSPTKVEDILEPTMMSMSMSFDFGRALEATEVHEFGR